MSRSKWGWDKELLEEHPLENNAFIEALFEPMPSPEGELSSEVRETLWPLLQKLQVDTKQRKIIVNTVDPTDHRHQILGGHLLLLHAEPYRLDRIPVGGSVLGRHDAGGDRPRVAGPDSFRACG